MCWNKLVGSAWFGVVYTPYLRVLRNNFFEWNSKTFAASFFQFLRHVEDNIIYLRSKETSKVVAVNFRARAMSEFQLKPRSGILPAMCVFWILPCLTETRQLLAICLKLDREGSMSIAARRWLKAPGTETVFHTTGFAGILTVYQARN